MVEKLVIKDKSGIGWIVILGLIPFLNLPVTLGTWLRAFNTQKLRTPAIFCISDTVSIGNAFGWSFPFFAIGSFTLLVTLIVSSGIGASSTFYMIVFSMFPLLQGAALCIHYNRYKKYIMAIDQCLIQVTNKGPNLHKTSLLESIRQNTGNVITTTKLHAMLNDLVENKKILYQTTEEKDDIQIKIIAYELVGKVSSPISQPKPAEKVCEYCDTVRTDMSLSACPCCGATY